MHHLRILALSSSRAGNSGYLETALPLIKDMLVNASDVAFIPFASVDGKYEEYTSKVRAALEVLSLNMKVVEPGNAKKTIEQSDAIMVGGGNTFKLLHDIYALDLLNVIREKVNTGTPYIGWSAGSNLTGLTISTTNDMPVIEPESFKAFGFLPFQINPHYINIIQEDHNGETRDMRLSEFALLNPDVPVVGIPEGTALLLNEGKLSFTGKTDGVLFQVKDNAVVKSTINKGADVSWLLNQ